MVVKIYCRNFLLDPKQNIGTSFIGIIAQVMIETQ